MADGRTWNRPIAYRITFSCSRSPRSTASAINRESISLAPFNSPSINPSILKRSSACPNAALINLAASESKGFGMAAILHRYPG